MRFDMKDMNHNRQDGSEFNVRLVKGYQEIPHAFRSILPGDVFKEFWTYGRSQKTLFIFLVFLTLLQGVIAGGGVWLVKTAIDYFFHQKDLKGALYLVGALFMATVVKSAVEFFSNWNRNLTIARMRDTLIIKAFEDFLDNPFSIHIQERDRRKYGWILSDALNFITSFFNTFNSWVKQPFILVSTIIALMVISPLLTLAGIIVIPIGLPCLIFLKRKLKEFIAQRKLLLGMLEEIVAEGIKGIRIIKTFGLERHMVRKLKQSVDRQREINLRNAFFVGLMSPVSETLGLLGLAVIIFIGSQDILSGSFTAGTFFVFIMSFLNMYRPIKDISNGLLNYQMALDAGRRLISLQRNAQRERSKKGKAQIGDFQQLEIKNLWFSYNERPLNEQSYVLRDLNLFIQRGEMVSLVGTTGAGKSTLCDILFGLYAPQKGMVFINEVPFHQIDDQSIKRIFSLCSQETIVFNNSLLEEIRIARPTASRDEVQVVAEAAGLSPYIATLSAGLDTWVGDRGVHCSGGQRQMIALARSLLQRPELLVLDEAMAMIDMETGRRIWWNIRKFLPDCTILVISHHWHIIKHCDRVMVLSEGAVYKDMPVQDIRDPDQFFEEFQMTNTHRGEREGLGQPNG